MKKYLPLIVISLFLVGGLFFLVRSRQKPAVVTPKPKKPVVTMIDELPEEDRPVIALSSRLDGRELTLDITNIKNFEIVEYELVYLTEGVQRGFLSEVDLEAGQSDLSRDLLLGTCSRGKCRFDTNVTGGTLTVIFRGPQSYKSVQEFTLSEADGQYTVELD